MRQKGMTLVEILVILIIVAIIAGIAMPNFGGLRERSLGKEAKVNIRLISEAQMTFRLKNNVFYPNGASQTNIDNINSNLSLSLTGANWAYTVNGTANTFSITADRQGTGGYLDCSYALSYNISSTANAEEPTAASACPK